MTHKYIVNDEKVVIIYNDGVEVGQHGPWETKKEASAWADMILADYNDPKKNPNNVNWPTLWDEEKKTNSGLVIPG